MRRSELRTVSPEAQPEVLPSRQSGPPPARRALLPPRMARRDDAVAVERLQDSARRPVPVQRTRDVHRRCAAIDALGPSAGIGEAAVLWPAGCLPGDLP